MSTESWKEEFYPVSATRFEYRQDIQVNAAKHSIKKWRGFYPSNLKKHRVWLSIGYLTDGRTSIKATGSLHCALCRVTNSCKMCVLSRVGAECSNNNSPYQRVNQGASPKVLIDALKKALKLAEKEGI